MATIFSVPAILRVRRSTQSSDKVMTAAYVAEYTNNNPYAWLFSSAEIDLSAMIALDVVDIRVRKIVEDGGNWRVHHHMQYTGVRPAGHTSVKIGPLLDVFGVSIEMRQTVGALQTFYVEAFDAIR
ncbi:hypothetical protein LCGC14_2959900 [marine sediment metagenome]|uniref:Uncharacterized protein n=1 Tax=marine sediment metagenome TaxID=412755 RepID=A0A0F9A3X9_9ZZZZ